MRAKSVTLVAAPILGVWGICLLGMLFQELLAIIAPRLCPQRRDPVIVLLAFFFRNYLIAVLPFYHISEPELPMFSGSRRRSISG
jgi:hypothetical protein